MPISWVIPLMLNYAELTYEPSSGTVNVKCLIIACLGHNALVHYCKYQPLVCLFKTCHIHLGYSWRGMESFLCDTVVVIA